jgi:hypothetical protein
VTKSSTTWDVKRRVETRTGFWWGNLGKETTWKTTFRWEDNIKIDLKENNGRPGRPYSGVTWLGIESNGDILLTS